MADEDTLMEGVETTKEVAKKSKKRKSVAPEDAANPEEKIQQEESSSNIKKDKKKKEKDPSNDQKSDKKIKKESNDNDNDVDQHLNLDALSPIAHPLADKKLCKRVLRTVKKGSKQRFIKRGVKEVVKALRKGEKGLVVMAGDISPMDVLTHIPLLAEENGSGYIFVPTKESLGAASSTKRPTSCVMISTSRGGSQAVQKKLAEKREALIAQDPTKAAKIDAEVEEYTTAYNAVLSEVLQLVSLTLRLI